MIRTFVSYHHALDQEYKDAFVDWAASSGLVDDMSVSTGEIDENLGTETIRRIIRDDYLRDTEVTVVLCGQQTRFRKHVDWEIKSSMIDGRINRQSGILCITLPGSGSTSWHAVYSGEKELVYPDYTGSWTSVGSMQDLEKRYPGMPRRVLENLLTPGVRISISPWERIFRYPERLRFLLENTALSGRTNQYDLRRPMRMKNFNPAMGSIDVRR